MKLHWRAIGLLTVATTTLVPMAGIAVASPSPVAASCFRVSATIHVAPEPFGVAVNLATNTIYVTNGNQNTVSVINGQTNKITATFPGGGSPDVAAVNPRTDTLYVTNLPGGTVSVITRHCRI